MLALALARSLSPQSQFYQEPASFSGASLLTAAPVFPDKDAAFRLEWQQLGGAAYVSLRPLRLAAEFNTKLTVKLRHSGPPPSPPPPSSG